MALDEHLGVRARVRILKPCLKPVGRGAHPRWLGVRMAPQERVRVSYEALDRACCAFKTPPKQFIKCHFQWAGTRSGLGFAPF